MPVLCNRRHFLRRAGAYSLGATALSPLALSLATMGSASASAGAGYKALVCLFMVGGNDAYNTVLATDTASWTAYGTARAAGTDPVALAAAGAAPVAGSASLHARLGGVLPIQPRNDQGRSYALHPVLGALRGLFEQDRLAVIANVGPLVRPMSKEEYFANAAPLPPKLFSHNDQQSVWQSLSAEGATQGWGGRLVDPFVVANGNPMFTSISLSGAQVWAAGNAARNYQLAPTGVVRIGSPDGLLFGSPAVQQKMLALMRTSRSKLLMQQDHAALAGRSMDAEGVLSGALPAADAGPWGDQPGLLNYRQPDTGALLANPVAQKLQAVARMIAARGALGMNRQMFFVAIEGFDTHDMQNSRHGDNLAQLAHAMAYFDNTLRRMGVGDAVTTFTASDFGRGFATNGDGTDHGWGGHQFVMGGSVKGGDIYGRFPTYGLPDGLGGFASGDQLRSGALLPAISVEQYAAGLGRWFGVSDADLLTMLPGLGNIDAASRQLGFMV